VSVSEQLEKERENRTRLDSERQQLASELSAVTVARDDLLATQYV
jgi:hypothetical protein